jgi:protein-tyrosine phosphatase
VALTETIKHDHGSKRGLVRYLNYELLRRLGVYRRFNKIDYANVKRLVFVCKGNICRSPLAEAVARKHAIPSQSFGLDTRGNDVADPRAVAWGLANGYDLSAHITSRVDQYQPQPGDLLIGMEPAHVYELEQRFAQAPVQITLIGLWLPRPLAYLHDPYNSCEQYFEKCETLVTAAVVNLMEKLKG